MIELLRKLRSSRSCLLILPPGALTPQGIEGAMKRDVTNISVPSSDVPAEVDLLQIRLERHAVEHYPNIYNDYLQYYQLAQGTPTCKI